MPLRAPLSLRAPTRVWVGPLLAAVAAVTLLSPPAQADVVVHRDARHDVRETRTGQPGSTARPKRAEPDVTRIKVSYNRQRLRLQVGVRQLSERRNHAALVQIVTRDFTAGVYVTRIPGRDLLSVTLIRGFGDVVDCPDLEYRMFFPKGIVRVVVPRSCLDRAPWVRVGFALSWTTTRRSLTDDALSTGLTTSARLTRRLHAAR